MNSYVLNANRPIVYVRPMNQSVSPRVTVYDYGIGIAGKCIGLRLTSYDVGWAYATWLQMYCIFSTYVND